MDITPTDLRTRRLAASMSRRELAAQLGVAEDVLAQWEWGDRPIDCPAAIEQALSNVKRERPEGRT